MHRQRRIIKKNAKKSKKHPKNTPKPALRIKKNMQNYKKIRKNVKKTPVTDRKGHLDKQEKFKRTCFLTQNQR